MANQSIKWPRTDDEQEHIVRMGIALAGKAEAYRYLLKHGVRVEIIERVLDDAGKRRPTDRHCI